MKWIEQYKLNYKGESDEAKECEQYLKANYKGDVYLPWAFMVRCLFTQDPDATYDYIPSENGSMVHENRYMLETKNTRESRNVSKEDEIIKMETMETSVPIVCPHVVMTVTFLGKTFTETYPVQDNSYEAPKAINQNMLNKAKQRCLARLISMATGIGWRLYEGKDLQFEDDGKQPSKSAVQVAEPVKPKVAEAPKPKMDLNEPAEIPEPSVASEDITPSAEAQELAKFIFNYEDRAALDKALAGLNNSVLRKYGFVFKSSDSILEVTQKACKLDKPDKFLASVKNKLGA